MNSIADDSLIIQTSSQCVPSTPHWFGEVALTAQHLRKQGILSAIGERVRFARRRFGHYDVIDFVAVLFGYAISGERTLEVFYQRLQPFAPAFMALFGRERLPSRSTLSRFLASLTQPSVEALRTLFLEDLLTRPLNRERQTGELIDRAGSERVVFDIDGTREAARQRALPKTAELPAPQRRLDELCAPGYTGRKRGEIVCTRTIVSQAHTAQWLGSFANPGNGRYREELRRAVAAIQLYSKAHDLPEERVMLRLDGQYGTGAVLTDLAGFCYVTRGKDYTVLDRTEVQSRLHLPSDQQFRRPESDLVRTLYDCMDVPVGPTGQRCRVVVATHPANAQKSRIGLTRSGLVYELFFTNLPQSAFTTADVVALYLHRGAFEPTLADPRPGTRPRPLVFSLCEWAASMANHLAVDLESPSRTGASTGTDSDAYRLSFAPAIADVSENEASTFGYAPPEAGLPWKAGHFSGRDFVPQSDGSLRCPAGKSLHPNEERREADGSLRVLFAAKIRDCRGCHLREQCQWHGTTTKKPRRVSLLLHPLGIGTAPVLWKDWSRRHTRRAAMQLCRSQRVEMQVEEASGADPPASPSILSRAQRAHYRLSWKERLARNARPPGASRVRIKLFGIPEVFAASLGLASA